MKVKNIMNAIEDLELGERFELFRELGKRYSLTFVHEPTVIVALSSGQYDVFWMLPEFGVAENNSEAANEFQNKDSQLFEKLKFLVSKFQYFLLGRKGFQEYLETANDRKLVKALERGGKLDMETGEIVDLLTNERI